MTGWLRALAIGIAIAAVIDPRVTRSRPGPAVVDVQAFPSRSDPDGAEAARIRQALITRLGTDIELGSGAPGTVVTIGAAIATAIIPDGVPVAVVAMEPPGRNVQIVSLRAPRAVVPGHRSSLTVVVQGAGVQGETSTIVLERDGLELARAAHRWTADEERASLTLTCAVPGVGVVPMRVRALPLGGEVTAADNVADVGLRVLERPLQVLTWEPRPSWAATFARRALEADDAFEVASLVRSSRGVETRSGAAPRVLTASALAPFDAVVVGAPEELTRAEVDALEAFVRDRGGAAVFLPDRLPAGAYRRLLPASAFDERLLDRPAALVPAVGGEVRGSEFALPSGGRGEALLSLPQAGSQHPVVVSWPSGAGQIVFSGALDAWRFRGSDAEAFAAFWTATVAGVASASPAPLAVSVEPQFAAPGDTVTVRARYRATELSGGPARIRVPAIRAELAAAGAPGVSAAPGASGVRSRFSSDSPLENRDLTPTGAAGAAGAVGVADGMHLENRDLTPAVGVRLWPAATAGSYEGSLRAPAAGRFEVRVSGGGGLVAEAPLVVSAGARTAAFAPAPRWLAAATGGVAADASDLAAVDSFLRRLPRPAVPVELHPMRTAWWIVPFTLALGAEWALRRRKGLR